MRDKRPQLRNWKVQPPDRVTRDEADSDDGGGGRDGGTLDDTQLGIVQGGLVIATDGEGQSSNEGEVWIQIEDVETPAETADALLISFFSAIDLLLTRAHALLSDNGHQYVEDDIARLAALSCAHEVEGHTNTALWNDLGEHQSTRMMLAARADGTAAATIFATEPNRDEDMKRAIAWYCTNQDANWNQEDDIVRAQELTELFNSLPPEVA